MLTAAALIPGDRVQLGAILATVTNRADHPGSDRVTLSVQTDTGAILVRQVPLGQAFPVL